MTVRVKNAISVLFFLYCVAVIIFKLPFYFGAYLSMPQLLAVALIFVFVLHFLSGKPGEKAKQWIDILPLLLGLPGSVFIAFFYEKALDYEGFGFLDTPGTFLAFSLALALIILVYRRTTWAMPALIIIMLLIVHYQRYLPGLLRGVGFELSRLGFSFYMGTHGIFGVPFKIATTILISFIFFGRLFQSAGGGKWFLDISAFLLGSAPGGMAKVAVMASAFFGMISGSPSANTASTGAITIPMMIRTGYSPALAGAIEAVASTGGQFMPPVMGAIIFIMAEWLEIPYSSVAIMAVLPAVLYYIIVFSTIHFEALRLQRPVIAHSEKLPLPELLKRGWLFILPLSVLIVLLLGFQYDPEAAVLFSIPVMIGCSFFSKDKNNWLTPSRIYQSIAEGVIIWLTIASVTAAVGMLIGALTLSGIGVKISSFLIAFSGGRLFILLIMVGLASFILGMGLDSIPCYITVAILTAPALMKIGVPDFAAHLFVIYWGMASFFTPPVCLAVYVACGISRARVGETGLHAVRLGIGVFLIPIAFVLHPALLMSGSLLKIVLTGIIATLAAIAMGSGSAGYFVKTLNYVQRMMLVIGAVFMIMPNISTIIVGFILLIIPVMWQLFQKNALKYNKILF